MNKVLQKDRIVVVDALRGFAVVAIMLLHFIEHFIYGVYPEPSGEIASSINTGVWDALFFIFAGKSYTIFALLFGFTFAIQQQNQVDKRGDFGLRFAWRLLLLMVFATINAAFFPGGDVLMLFAIMGFVMIPLRNLNIKPLFWIAMLFLIQPIELLENFNLITVPSVLNNTYYPVLKEVTTNGNFFEMAWTNMTIGQLASISWAVDAGRLLQAPGLFILGMILAKGSFFKSDKKTFWVKVFVGGVIASFVLYVAKVSAVLELKTIFTMWYNIAFTAILVSSFVMLYQYEIFQRWTNGLRFYGRMSLTNYISQSIIGSLIFFPYALALADDLAIAWSFVVGLGVMFVQISFCKWWFGQRKIGPLEGVWHKLTWIGAKLK